MQALWMGSLWKPPSENLLTKKPSHLFTAAAAAPARLLNACCSAVIQTSPGAVEEGIQHSKAP